MTVAKLKNCLENLAESKRAEVLLCFPQTQKGGYGETDQFIGVTVPNQRKVANKFDTLTLLDIETLLQTSIHEHRLTLLFIMIRQFEREGS